MQSVIIPLEEEWLDCLALSVGVPYECLARSLQGNQPRLEGRFVGMRGGECIAFEAALKKKQ